MARHNADKVADIQDKIARSGLRVIRRELMIAARSAVNKYAASGQLAIPESLRMRLWAVISQVHTAAVREAVGRTQTLLKSGAPEIERKFDFPSLVERFVFEFGAAYLGAKVTSIEASLLGALTMSVQQGMLAGETQPEIAKRVGLVANRLTRTQAARIARTEVHGASGFASMRTAEIVGDADILVREWVAVGDERTRSDHQSADGQTVEIGSPFNVGGEMLMYPGDPAGSAGNVINCRCVAVEALR